MEKSKVNGAIEIVCDGGGTYGFGHIRRSYTLAQEFKKRGYAVRLRAATEVGSNVLPHFDSSNQDVAIRILDLPYEIKTWLEQSSSSKVPVIALDYFGDAKVSLVISIYEHMLTPPLGYRLSGLEYALIRNEIVELAPALTGQRIIVMIGGSDINRVGELVSSHLADHGLTVNLIQGPAFQGDYKTNSPHINVLKTPEDLEVHMAGCEWAVTNGGGSMMEMMCLGKAVHVIPQTDAERCLAELIFDEGGIIGIGVDTLEIPSTDKIIRVGGKACALVDGLGAGRIINQIEERYIE